MRSNAFVAPYMRQTIMNYNRFCAAPFGYIRRSLGCHTLGKGEVDSSILSCSTISSIRCSSAGRAVARTQRKQEQRQAITNDPTKRSG